MQIGLVPGLHVGMGDAGTGCFAASEGLTRVLQATPLVHARHICTLHVACYTKQHKYMFAACCMLHTAALTSWLLVSLQGCPDPLLLLLLMWLLS